MQQSESINELAKALNAAQAEFKGAVKDATNPFFKSNYADLASVIDAVKDGLAKHGLSVVQMTDYDERNAFVETQIMHTSGQWIRGRFPIMMKDANPQTLGSSCTYSRRYALQAALCIPAVDDDAQAAQAAYKPANAPTKPQQQTMPQPQSRAAQMQQPVKSGYKPKAPADLHGNFNKDVL